MMLHDGRIRRRLNAFQPVRKCRLIIAMLTKGAMLVASAAPLIPIPRVNMKT